MDKRDIVEVISEILDSPMTPLGPPGRHYYHILCPFHDDREPSFFVREYSQRCGCYVCWNRPKGYDVIDFYRKLYDVSFEEAKKAVTTEVPAHILAKRRLLKKPVEASCDAYARELANLIRKSGKNDLQEIAATVTRVREQLTSGRNFREILRQF